MGNLKDKQINGDAKNHLWGCRTQYRFEFELNSHDWNVAT